MIKTDLLLLPGLLLRVALTLMICSVFSTQIFAQQKTSAKNGPDEVTSLCNPAKLENSITGNKNTYTCEGKRPTPRPGASSKYKAVRSARADINCSYTETNGEKEWLGCTCTADEDSKCTGFIIWCATQGEEISGNSSGASCSPKG